MRSKEDTKAASLELNRMPNIYIFQKCILINRHFTILRIIPPKENKHYLALSLNTNLKSKFQQLSSFINSLHFWANGRYLIIIILFVQLT